MGVGHHLIDDILFTVSLQEAIEGDVAFAAERVGLHGGWLEFSCGGGGWDDLPHHELEAGVVHVADGEVDGQLGHRALTL